MPGLSDTAHIEYLDSFDDCLAAVHAGTVDAYYTYTYQAERTVFDDTRNELRSMLSGEQRNFCIGVRQDYDVLLRTVLNKSIDSLTRAEISTITNAYVNLGQQPFSLTRLAYQYPAIIVLTCLCVLVTAVCIALVIRAQRFRAETEKPCARPRRPASPRRSSCPTCPTTSAHPSTALWVCWTLPRTTLTTRPACGTA